MSVPTGQADAVAALFAWPERAAYGKLVPKSRIAKRSSVRGLKDLLSAQVDTIHWAFELGPDSLNVQPSTHVPFIQVFLVTLKPGAAEKFEMILRGIDQAIPSPIVFEVTGEQGVCTAAAYKRPSEADAGKQVLGDYFRGQWLPPDAARQSLPVAMDMQGLYWALMQALVPYPAKPGEPLPELLQRVSQIRTLQRQCTRLAAQLTRERQFNRQVDINRQLREQRNALDRLRG